MTPSTGTAQAPKRHFGETRTETALQKHAHRIRPGGSSSTQEGKHRVENTPTLGSFMLFVWLHVFDTDSPDSTGKLFCSVGSFRVGFGWPILQGDPCKLLKAQMENKHRLIPPRMGKKGLEQLRWEEVHLCKHSSEKCSKTNLNKPTPHSSLDNSAHC